jgi:ABC-type Fe3+ transport system substrate-binding protein
MGGLEGKSAAEAFFKKNFGIDLDYRFTPGGPMGVVGNKIATEFRAGQKSATDVWAGAAPQIVPLLKLDMFHAVQWTSLYPARITATMVEADGRALRMATGLPSVLYNKNRAPEFVNISSMEDLLKPEYKGRFATTPFAAGFDVLLSKDVWGEQKTFSYVERLAKQVQGLLSCGAEDRLASGEFLALALDCASNAVNIDQYRNVLAVRIVADNAQMRPYYALVPKHAPHPNMGILFGLYLSSPEGQGMMLKIWGEDAYEYPESAMRKMVQSREREGVVFRDISIAWWQSNSGIDQANNNLTRILRAASQ